MDLMPLKMGRLDERLRSAIKEGIKARGGRKGRKKAAGVDKETRERRPAREGVNRKENIFPTKTRPTRGLDGLAG
jgi:hypothetical protein